MLIIVNKKVKLRNYLYSICTHRNKFNRMIRKWQRLFSLILSFQVGGVKINSHSITVPLLRIFLCLFPEQSAFLAIIQFLIGLSNVQELQNFLPAIYRRQFTCGMSVDVQRPDITTEFYQEFHAEFVAPRCCQVQARITEIIGLVRITSTMERSYYTEKNVEQIFEISRRDKKI